jgi:hypothetical protein
VTRAIFDRRITYVFTVAFLGVAIANAVRGDAVGAATFGFIAGMETHRSIGLWFAHRYDREESS